jgi:hypothetical protein
MYRRIWPPAHSTIPPSRFGNDALCWSGVTRVERRIASFPRAGKASARVLLVRPTVSPEQKSKISRKKSKISRLGVTARAYIMTIQGGAVMAAVGRVLVVEDDRLFAEAVDAALGSRYQVRCVANGSDAIAPPSVSDAP